MNTEPFYKWLEYQKQHQQNFAIVIWIYDGSTAADAECHHKFRGLGIIRFHEPVFISHIYTL